jgi:hypothetical protein
VGVKGHAPENVNVKMLDCGAPASVPAKECVLMMYMILYFNDANDILRCNI